MNKQEERRLVAETKALIKEVEAGQTDRAAWIAIQDRVRELYLDEEGRPFRTQVEVGELLGKKRDWISEVLAWDAEDLPTPFSHAANLRRQHLDRNERGAKTALRDPTSRAKVIAELEPADLARLAREAEIEAARKMEGEHTESKRNAKAIRQEHPQSTSKIQEMLIGTILDSARSRVVEAVRKLVDAEGELTEKALERLQAKNEELATAVEAVDELLTGRTDWDAALAELTEGR